MTDNSNILTVKCARSWQKRRVIITKNVISFAFVGEEDQLDYIPFAEIEFVRSWEDDTVAGIPTFRDSSVDMDRRPEALTAVHIGTSMDGYNSGRAYYISAGTSAQRARLIEHLQRNAKAAKLRAEASTMYQRVQLTVRRNYESPILQYFVAGLIAAVCPKSLLPSLSRAFATLNSSLPSPSHHRRTYYCCIIAY